MKHELQSFKVSKNNRQDAFVSLGLPGCRCCRGYHCSNSPNGLEHVCKEQGLQEINADSGHSWNTFKLNFNQTTIETIADALVSTGLRDAGYNYLVMDDGWQELTRDDTGRQQANTTKLPSGIAALADYVHQRNLSFGIYSDAG